MIKNYFDNLYKTFIGEYKEIFSSSNIQLNDNISILSLGAGLCPDLIALDLLEKNQKVAKNIHYTGVDINPLWKRYIDEIEKKSYSNENVTFKYVYEPAYEFIKSTRNKYDIIILGHIVSAMCSSSQWEDASNLLKKIITRLNVEGYIIINDTPFVQSLINSKKEFSLKTELNNLISINKSTEFTSFEQNNLKNEFIIIHKEK